MPDSLHQRTVRELANAFYGRPLINNVERGHYVECMVRLALNERWHLTNELRGWAPWDIERDDGARLEVKQSAALQPWSTGEGAPQPRASLFDIASRKEAWTKGGGHAPYCPGRPADIYIFAWHPILDPEMADHRCYEQWSFFVVPEQELPERKTISINPLKKLAHGIRYGQLAITISAELRRIGKLKAEREVDEGRYIRTHRFDDRNPGE